MSIFAQATRLKLRFDTSFMATGRGMLTVEDLWDLPLTSRKNRLSLDVLAIDLDEKVEKSGRTSFVRKETETNKLAKLRFDIVKHMIDVKLAEEEAADRKAERATERKELIEGLAAKRKAEIGQMSTDDIQKRLAALDEADKTAS